MVEFVIELDNLYFDIEASHSIPLEKIWELLQINKRDFMLFSVYNHSYLKPKQTLAANQIISGDLIIVDENY